MIFKRKIYNELLSWKQKYNGAKAIMIEGARRIGKSTIAECFAKDQYKSYILIDFAFVSENIKNAFNNNLNDLDTFFMILSYEYSTPLYPRNSLIIFDEVQKFPRAREAIKLLVKDGRYDYIETGSLISIKENVKNILIPSDEQTLDMYPLDFEEFCIALGEEKIIKYIKQCFIDKKPLERSLHNKSMMLFKQYMLIGGMPKPLSLFIKNNKQFYQTEDEKNNILKTYKNDIRKINSKYKGKVSSIFDQLPGFLSKHGKRVIISKNNKNDRITQYYETFFWLEDSRICNMCFKCNDPNTGLSLNEERTYIKAYLNDTGLLLTHTFSDNNKAKMFVYSKILSDKLNINKGMFYENCVAQMLKANGHKLYFYTHYNEQISRNDIEVDFILSDNNNADLKIIPIEVKSSKKYKMDSLEKFCIKFSERISKAYIIHPKNLIIKDDKIICLPVYMTFCL